MGFDEKCLKKHDIKFAMKYDDRLYESKYQKGKDEQLMNNTY